MRKAIVVLLIFLLAACGTRDSAALGDLDSPRGLTSLEDGSLLVAEVAGGRVLKWFPGKQNPQIILDNLPATRKGPEQSPSGVAAALVHAGATYFIVGEYRAKGYRELYRSSPGELPVGITGQDLMAVRPPNRLTNPFDLVVAPAGGFFVSDSGRDAVWHIAEDGMISDYALFDAREIRLTDGLAVVAVVPTGMTIGPDGALYVASLTGYPFPPGRAYVYRLADGNGDGDALDEGETTVYAKGFSAATDVAFDSDGGLLVTEFSLEMERLAGIGFSHAEDAPGRLVSWRAGTRKILADNLVSPTGVAVLDGRVFVSEEFAGRVTEVR